MNNIFQKNNHKSHLQTTFFLQVMKQKLILQVNSLAVFEIANALKIKCLNSVFCYFLVVEIVRQFLRVTRLSINTVAMRVLLISYSGQVLQPQRRIKLNPQFTFIKVLKLKNLNN